MADDEDDVGLSPYISERKSAQTLYYFEKYSGKPHLHVIVHYGTRLSCEDQDGLEAFWVTVGTSVV